MKTKYKIKKKKQFSVFWILFILILLLISMGISYAKFSTNLNILGSVTLELEEAPPLIIDVPPTEEDEEGDPVQFTLNNNFSNGLTNVLELVSENMDGNHLTTVTKIVYRPLFFNPTISVSFNMLNQTNYSFTNGTVVLDDSQYTSNSISSISPNISPVTLEPGETATFTLSFLLKPRNVGSSSTLSYDISYNMNGLTRHFFYTITILPYGS